jgi:DNA-binding response OmpR family regulator
MVKRPRILFITDNVSLARVTCAVLEKNGFDAIPKRAIESLEPIQQGRPDLILLDLMLAGSNGLDAYRQLKADAQIGSVPVLALASIMLNIDEMVELHIAEAGDYLIKPFSADELLDSIGCVLGKR